MVMRRRNVQSTSRSASPFRQWRKRALTVATSLLVCGVLVVENGAEQVDSGWAFAPQPGITVDAKSHDPRQQIIFQDVLQQTNVPLLQTTPTATSLNSEGALHKSTPGVRLAIRPDGIDGWRPIEPSAASNNDSWSAAAPQLDSSTKEGVDEPSGGSAVESVTIAPSLKAAQQYLERGCGDERQLQWSSSNIASLQTNDDKSVEPINEEQDDSASSDVADEEYAESDSIEESGSADSVEAEGRGGFGSMLREKITDGTADTENAASDRSKTASTGSSISDISGDDTAAQEAKKPTPPPLTKQLVNLRGRVRGVLKGYYRRQLNSRDNDPWEVMHGMLAYGVHSRVRQGGPRGPAVTSVGWLCYNKPCKNLTLLYVNPKGELRAKYGVGLQGHLGQMLAMLAQCRVSDEYPIRVGKREFTIKDLIEAEKKTCYPKSELTFKLLAFQYYLDLNDTWVNDQGVEWNFPRLIREELSQPMRGAACGGTHRLSSLSLTVKARQRRGEPLDGEYQHAYDFVQKHHKYAFSLQNRDGSLSTQWFNGRGDDSDINRRIKTTGHILEWLCYSLDDEELRQPRMVNAVTYLANLMYSKYDNDWEVGPMSHATHALLLYDERVFQPFDGAEYEALYKPKPRSTTNNANRVQVQNRR